MNSPWSLRSLTPPPFFWERDPWVAGPIRWVAETVESVKKGVSGVSLYKSLHLQFYIQDHINSSPLTSVLIGWWPYQLFMCQRTSAVKIPARMGISCFPRMVDHTYNARWGVTNCPDLVAWKYVLPLKTIQFTIIVISTALICRPVPALYSTRP